MQSATLHQELADDLLAGGPDGAAGVAADRSAPGPGAGGRVRDPDHQHRPANRRRPARHRPQGRPHLTADAGDARRRRARFRGAHRRDGRRGRRRDPAFPARAAAGGGRVGLHHGARPRRPRRHHRRRPGGHRRRAAGGRDRRQPGGRLEDQAGRYRRRQRLLRAARARWTDAQGRGLWTCDCSAWSCPVTASCWTRAPVQPPWATRPAAWHGWPTSSAASARACERATSSCLEPCTGWCRWQPEDVFRAEFAHLGAVTVRFSNGTEGS